MVLFVRENDRSPMDLGYTAFSDSPKWIWIRYGRWYWKQSEIDWAWVWIDDGSRHEFKFQVSTCILQCNRTCFIGKRLCMVKFALIPVLWGIPHLFMSSQCSSIYLPLHSQCQDMPRLYILVIFGAGHPKSLSKRCSIPICPSCILGVSQNRNTWGVGRCWTLLESWKNIGPKKWSTEELKYK